MELSPFLNATSLSLSSSSSASSTGSGSASSSWLEGNAQLPIRPDIDDKIDALANDHDPTTMLPSSAAPGIFTDPAGSQHVAGNCVFSVMDMLSMKGYLGGFLSGLVFSVMLLMIVVFAVNIHRRRRVRQLKHEIAMSSLTSPCLLDIKTITDDKGDDTKVEIDETGIDNVYQEPSNVVSMTTPVTSDNRESRGDDSDKDVKFRRLKEDDTDIDRKSSIRHTYMSCEDAASSGGDTERDQPPAQHLYQNPERTSSGYRSRASRSSERRQTTV